MAKESNNNNKRRKKYNAVGWNSLRLHRLRPLHPSPSKVLAEFYIDSTPSPPLLLDPRCPPLGLAMHFLMYAPYIFHFGYLYCDTLNIVQDFLIVSWDINVIAKSYKAVSRDVYFGNSRRGGIQIPPIPPPLGTPPAVSNKSLINFFI